MDVISQEFTPLSESQLERQRSVYKNAVIAHRGTTYWAPESTEFSYRWARNIGADYLEVDIQRTKDGVLIVLHDEDLLRTTNAREVFSNYEEEDLIVPNFTYEELLNLDAGSWFNELNPDRAREDFSVNAKVIKTRYRALYFPQLYSNYELNPVDFNAEKYVDESDPSIYAGGKQLIMTLEDVVMISKGWLPAKNKKGERIYNLEIDEDGKSNYKFYYTRDLEDNGNRPGIYIETKEPSLYPGIEKDLYQELDRFGYLDTKETYTTSNFYINGYVNTGNTHGAIVLQTFSLKSLALLNKQFRNKIPITLLLWKGDSNMQDDSIETYQKNIEYAILNGASFIGPSIGGEPNNYHDLLKKEHVDLIRKSNLRIHAYSFDTEGQSKEYFESRVDNPSTDAFFTNKSEFTINQLIKLKVYDIDREFVDAKRVLDELRY